MDAEQIKTFLDTCFDQLLDKLATEGYIAELRNEVTELMNDKIEAPGKQIHRLKLELLSLKRKMQF